MRKLFVFIALLATVVALTASAAGAAKPVFAEHVNFTSDPYDDNWCGIEGTSVDRVVSHYMEDATGASREALNVTTLFTATTSGKSMEIRSTGARRATGEIDNGDGTYSIVFTNAGQSPSFKLENGPPIALDVGLLQGVVTFDAATGDFISFDVVKEVGQRPLACDAIIAALT